MKWFGLSLVMLSIVLLSQRGIIKNISGDKGSLDVVMSALILFLLGVTLIVVKSL